MALAVKTDADDASLRGFMRKEISQLNLTSDGWVSLHLQQTTLSVHLSGLATFSENFTVRLLPGRFHRRDEGKTSAPPLSTSWRRLIRHWLCYSSASMEMIERPHY